VIGQFCLLAECIRSKRRVSFGRSCTTPSFGEDKYRSYIFGYEWKHGNELTDQESELWVDLESGLEKAEGYHDCCIVGGDTGGYL
jgi:hypothetical protein